ncbi:MAG: hypothetical protein KZQ80_11060 [Candidatus Thiodiazotropha sp. (ex Monitilora ramsayi)]|nr:hypothetical protein [Candidatus Thiodiazotropha sp. (ex Monitilora ramsayi)]
MGVFALVEERPSTSFPLIPVEDTPNMYEGPVPTRSCPEVINLQYEVRFERDDLFGRRNISILDPDPGYHRISIIGESPESCRAGAGVANRLVVNSSEDAIDTNPGDGICSSGEVINGVPTCTLRAAIMEANATQGQDVIEVPNGTYELSLVGNGALETDPEKMATIGDLDITDGVSIYGDLQATQANQLEVTVNGGDIARVFHIHPMSSSVEERIPYVHLEGLAITNGNAYEGGEDSRAGGGIHNSANLRLTRVHILRNRARDGGGIWNSMGAALVMDRTQIEANCVDSPRTCTVGAIWNNGSLTLSRSAVIHNESDDELSVIYNQSFSGYPPAVSQILNSTIAFNSAFQGAAIGGVGDITIDSSTIAFNRSLDVYGSMRVSGLRKLRLTNSLIVGNQVLVEPTGASGCNSGNPISGVGGNIYDDTDGCRFTTLLDNNRFIPATQPLRGLVYDGFTQSLRLTRDYIDQGIEFDVFCLHEDQNGAPRPADGLGDGVVRCDPGAVESQPSP